MLRFRDTPSQLSTDYWPHGDFVRWRAETLVHAVYYVASPTGGWERYSVCRRAARHPLVTAPWLGAFRQFVPYEPDACPRCSSRVSRYYERLSA